METSLPSVVSYYGQELTSTAGRKEVFVGGECVIAAFTLVQLTLDGIVGRKIQCPAHRVTEQIWCEPPI